MTFKDEATIVISQLRTDRDRLSEMIDKIREILDDYDLDAWEILEMIKEVVRE